MTKKEAIKIFEEKKVRTAWDDETEEWYFSVIDVIEILTDSSNPRRYWSDLKSKLAEEGSQLYAKIVQLKMLSPDGKMRLTDVMTTEQMFRLIQSILSPKAEPFKLWMAQTAKERLDEMQDPAKEVLRLEQNKDKSNRAMKIIIAGAGAVGTHLAKLLSREKQDIILMDDNEERLSTLSSNFDLMTVTASPTSIQGLKEVGARDADLFIAVTPDESRNMTACMLATNLGAKKTVARIDNYEYLLPKNKEFFKKLGVDSLIYPEMLAAKEIVSSIRMSWVRQWWEFCGGSLILIGTKMREKAEILDIPLHQLAETDKPYHVVAIKRCNETLIPRGDDVIKLHDIVYFTTTRKYVPYIRKIAGKEDYADVRNVMIMGGSRIAVRTAQYVPDYMQVKIIDNDLNRCNRLTELLDDKVMIINGDGRDMDLLIEEGLKNTEAFVALTENSETNILSCLAAKRMGVSKTVAEVENIDYIGMAESLDIGTVINKKMITASHIYQMMLDADVSNVKCLTFANADVAEFTVKADSKITKHQVKDLGLPKGTTIGGLIRQGEGVVVTGNTQILPGDHVVVFCLSMMIKKIEKYFN